MRIEILGPSGVGKTTILAAATSSAQPRRWLAPADLAPLMPRATARALREAVDRPARQELVEWAISIVAAAEMSPSQKISALTFLRRSCFEADAITDLALSQPVVHDELVLHRAFSLFPQVDDVDAVAREFFTRVELPDAAVVVTATPAEIVARVQARGRIPNVYQSRDPEQLHRVVAAAHRIGEVAAGALAERGLPVLQLDASVDAQESASRLIAFIDEQAPATRDDEIRARLLDASGSFRKKDGRHELRTQNVMYCAFSTPRFTIRPDEAQRDATKRVAAFGLTRGRVEGRTVLDLGSNAGAMLFEISNFNPAAGYGIEYDADKVDLANEIAQLAEIENIRFEQGDIDLLDAEQVGVHDIVLALAIEAHVQDQERLYRLLGAVTGELLCFEGNGSCDMDAARDRLAAVGFGDFVDLGFCQDDRDPRNNRRPQLLARKLAPKKAARDGGTTAKGLLSRLRGAHRSR